MFKFPTKDISAVIQGPVSDITKSCIKSIRKFLPEATIIISTDSKSDIRNLDYDKAVINQDVGAKYMTFVEGDKPNNINRQIVSTLNGIKKSKTKYTLKIRSDFILTGDDFLRYFDSYNKFNISEQFFEKRILACTLFTRKPRKPKIIKTKDIGFPYHLSDFVQFGLTKDLYKLWNVDLALDQDLNWFNSSNLIKNEDRCKHRYTIEQQIFIQFMKKNNISYYADYFCDRSEKNAQHTDLIMANNFVLLPLEKFCLEPCKNSFKPKFQLNYIGCYTHWDWLKIYKKYCDNLLKIGWFDWDFIKYLSFHWLAVFEVEINHEKIKKHLRKFFKPFKSFLLWIREPFLITFYLVKFLSKLCFRLFKVLTLVVEKHQNQ